MDEMLSVRIPTGLKAALEVHAQEHHFLDISEAVRGFLRKKMQASRQDPYLSEVTKLRESISKSLKEEALKKSRETLVAELRKIDNDLKREFK